MDYPALRRMAYRRHTAEKSPAAFERSEGLLKLGGAMIGTLACAGAMLFFPGSHILIGVYTVFLVLGFLRLDFLKYPGFIAYVSISIGALILALILVVFS